MTESGNVHICCTIQTSVGTKWVKAKAEGLCASHWGVGGMELEFPLILNSTFYGVNAKPRGKAAVLNKRMPPVPLNRKRREPWGRSGHFEKQQNMLTSAGNRAAIYPLSSPHPSHYTRTNCRFIHHRSCVNWSPIEPGALLWSRRLTGWAMVRIITFTIIYVSWTTIPFWPHVCSSH